MKIWEFVNLGDMKYHKLKRIEYENSEIKKLGYRNLGNNKFAQENLKIQRFIYENFKMMKVQEIRNKYVVQMLHDEFLRFNQQAYKGSTVVLG